MNIVGVSPPPFFIASPSAVWGAFRYRPVLGLLAFFLIGATFARGTIIASVFPGGMSTAEALYYVSVFVTGGYMAITAASKISLSTSLMLLGFGVGSVFAVYPGESLLRWASLCTIICIVGPLLPDGRAAEFRSLAWHAMTIGVVITSVVSVLWLIFPLPNVGRGLFSGATLQSKSLGITACLSVCIAAAWISRRNILWVFPIILVSVLMVLMSGARSSVIAMLAGLVVIAIVRGARAVKVTMLIFCSLMFGGLHAVETGFFLQSTETGQYYVEKGFSNTRSHLWSMRLSEIKSFPLFGVGIGMAEIILPDASLQEMESGIAYVDRRGRVNIEPGSSWLGILSMTGFVGGFLFLIVVGRALTRLRLGAKRINREKYAELIAVGVCFAVHMVEGGFLLSFGNPHCLFAWLWIGVACDAGGVLSLREKISRRTAGDGRFSNSRSAIR